MLRLQHGKRLGMKNETLEQFTIALVIFIFPMLELFQSPFSSNVFYSQKKREGKLFVYFRFLSTKKATMTIAATAATNTTVTSVVIKGVSGVTGVIGPEAVTAGPTNR